MSKKTKPKSSHPGATPGPDADRASAQVIPPDAGPAWWRRATHEPVALLFALVVLIRPWRDGYVFPYQNAYFVWAIVLIVTGWGIGALLRGDPIRSARPLALFAAFVLVAALMGFASIQPDTTYRNLLWWASHLGVFLIATNALRTRLAMGIVIAAFATTSMFEAAYGILHLQYKLPFMRMLVNLDPNMIAGLGTQAQIENRIASNRAFGSFLFPNALAAFAVMGIPYAFGAAVRSFAEWRHALALAPKTLTAHDLEQRKLISAAVGVITWFAGFVSASLLVFLILSPYKYYTVQTISGRPTPVSDPFEAHMGAWIWWLGLAPLIPAAATLVAARRYGVQAAWPAIRMVCAAALGCTELVTLALTYSRGGMLGLLVGLAAGAFLLWFAHGSSRPVNGLLARLLIPASVAVVFCAAIYANSFAYAQASPESVKSAVADTPKIDVAGNQRDLADTLDPTSARLRLSYWKTGCYMLKDHFLAGVGLGNFGTAYPVYQYLGSGDVKMAHNDFLQVWCETGILGLALFVGFWVYFLITGARRIVAEKDPAERWLLAGLYAGVLAFLAHSLVDFNFQNTALAFFVFLLAGLFCARTEAPQPPAKSRWAHQLLILLAIATAWIVAVAQVRVRAVDNLLDNPQKLLGTLQIADDIFQRLAPAKFNLQKPPQFRESDIAEFVPSLADQQQFAKIIVLNDTTARYLDPGEPIPRTDGTRMAVEVHDPATARAKLSAGVDMRIEQLETADATYPHDPALADAIYQWCELKIDTTENKDERKRWILKALAWAEEGARRSPMCFKFHIMLGKVLFQRAAIEPDAALAVDTLQRGIDQFRQAAYDYPTSEETWAKYGDALEKAGDAFKGAGDSGRGDALIAEGKKIKDHAKYIREFKERTHTGATG